ncbi:alpha/beta hydrolase family protein [Streptomyces sp. NPDC001380]|uniref:alpha/beta hydrolase family protein n=1 Tax=Streptomyces sp. NPDC001380 TaxID=3364566 RepID=UPI0036C9934A
MRKRRIPGVVAAAALAAAALGTGAPAARAADGGTAGAAEGVRTLTGTAGGVPFLADVPEHWNGTLLLWSHAYEQGGGAPPPEDADPAHPEVRTWLLDHGYALAGSSYPYAPFATREAADGQLALLDWFREHVGAPRSTVAWGRSLGGQLTAVLAERHPRRFAGALPMCGEVAGAVAGANAQLDMAFALGALLWPDADVRTARIADPAANLDRALGLLRSAYRSGPQGRARIALAAALADVPGWADSLAPAPADPDEEVLGQVLATLYQNGSFLWGPGRAELERLVGGNPSWNTGVDYAAQLDRSGRRAAVDEAYRRAGLDMDADLGTLAAAPRVSPDPGAVLRLAAQASVTGRVAVPTVTLHSTGDVTAPVENERRYGDLAAVQGRSGLLRQLYTARGNHCFFTGAEELTALRVLLDRVATGRWGPSDAASLNVAAAGFGPGYDAMTSYYQDGVRDVAPAFEEYRPGPFPRSPLPLPLP